MTKKNTTKRALFASVLSLLLCVSMLIGSTFAWFTDTASTGVNLIQSGNLDIVLSYKNATQKEWKEVNGEDKLFDDNALWEPGYTEVAYLKIENNGSLALKYQLTVNVLNEVAGKNKDGEAIKLSEVLKYDLIELTSDTTYADRDAALAAVSDAKNLATEIVSGNMEADADAKYFALVVYMPTTVGNEANHDGENVPSIQLGVNVLATQYDSESDSFGKDYDEYAPFIPEGAEIINIGTADELVAFAASNNTSADTYVMLTADIDMTDVAYTSISSFAGTFDGQGYTISNLTTNLFGTVSGTVKNLNVENVNILNTTKNGANGFINKVAEGGLIDNCKVSGVDIKWTNAVNANDTTDGFGGVICQVQAGATVQNCEFSDITVTSNGKTKRTGGVFSSIIGTVKGCVFTNVNFTVADTDTLEGWVTSHGGGLAGDVNGGAVVEKCVINNMQVNVYEAAGQLGGIFGKAHISGQTTPITLKDITVNGLTMNVGNALESMKNVAGFIGQPDSRKNDVRVAINNCHINGLDMTLASSKQGESAAAGFISGLCGGVDVTNCSVSGKIDGTNTPANIGGFVGDAGWYGSIEQNFTDCVANVDITVKDSIAGGFIAVDGILSSGGVYGGTATLNFNNCQATGTVTVVDGGTGTAEQFCGKTIE